MTFFLNGISFFRMCRDDPPEVIHESSTHGVEETHNANVSPPSPSASCTIFTDSEAPSDEGESMEPPPEFEAEQQVRLSTAGFAQHDLASKTQDSSIDELVDELHSNMYTSTLETLRDALAFDVPDTEPMMSRAIINAFSEKSESNAWDEALTVDWNDCIQLEAASLWETFEFIHWNFSSVDESRRLAFLQKQVDIVVSHVRHDALAADDAARIIMGVATILDLKVTSKLPRTTILLFGLKESVTTQDLEEYMLQFGDVEAVGLAGESSGFGVCRFESSSGVNKVLDSYFRNGIVISDGAPQIYEWDSPPRTYIQRTPINDAAPPQKLADAFEEEYGDVAYLDDSEQQSFGGDHSPHSPDRDMASDALRRKGRLSQFFLERNYSEGRRGSIDIDGSDVEDDGSLTTYCNSRYSKSVAGTVSTRDSSTYYSFDGASSLYSRYD